LTLKCDEPLSNLAFNFNLCRYNEEEEEEQEDDDDNEDEDGEDEGEDEEEEEEGREGEEKGEDDGDEEEGNQRDGRGDREVYTSTRDVVTRKKGWLGELNATQRSAARRFIAACRGRSRGLHSFRFQLNLSSPVHRVSQLHS